LDILLHKIYLLQNGTLTLLYVDAVGFKQEVSSACSFSCEIFW